MKPIFALIFCLSAVHLSAQSGTFQMDGFFDDWKEVNFTEKTPTPSDAIDLIELAVANDEQFLYLRIKVDREILLQQSDIRLWIDADNDPNTGRQLGNMGAELFYHFGDRFGFFLDQPINHYEIGLNALPTYSSDEFEIRISREAVPGGLRPLITSPDIKLLLASTAHSMDAIPEEETVSYAFEEGPFPAYVPIPLEKISNEHLRLMSYNVLFDRPLETAYRGSFQRIVRAVEADIFCFNEFFDGSAGQVKALIDEALPLGTAEGWYATKQDADNVVVSRFPIIQAFSVTNLGNITACLIDLPESYQTDLLVIAAHFSCCELEESRQLQADAVAALIEEAKNPGGRIDLPEQTPIILAGDLNLVGFRQQRTTLLTGAIQNPIFFGTAGPPDWDDSSLADLTPLHTEQALATTWINPFSSFAPGRLDYFIYSDSRLEAPRSYVLQSRALPADKRSSAELLFGDTDFSDHLPLVGDFKIKELVTSAEEVEAESFLRVYPNPAGDQLWVENAHSAGSKGRYTIFDQNGRRILQFTSQQGSQRFDLSNLPSGVYFLEWKTEEHIEMKKLVKR